MSRRSRRNQQDEPGVKAWLAGHHGQFSDESNDYGGEWGSDAAGSSWQEHGTDPRRSQQGGPSWETAAAPWQQGGPSWDTAAAPWQQGGPAAAPWEHQGWEQSSGHPSAPLPPVSGPMPAASSGPMPALDPPGWAGPARGGFGETGYPGGASAGPYGSHHDAYGPGGYTEQDYPASGYEDAGYEGADYPGTGYTQPAYPGGEHFGGEDAYSVHGGYPGRNGYASEDDYASSYQADQGYADTGDYSDYTAGGGGGRRGGPDSGSEYGDWYGDATGSHSWNADQYDDEFVPGLDRNPGSWDKNRSSRGGRGSSPRPRRASRGAGAWAFLIAMVLLLVLCGGGYFYYWRTYVHPPDWSGPGTGSVTVQIKSGDTAVAVGQRLVQLGVVESVRAFTNAAKASGKGSSLEPGYYRLHKHMNAALAFSLLLSPNSRVQIKVTIPEGLRESQIIAKLGAATGNLRGYKQAIKDVSALGLPSYAHGNPEGYLFPATYTFQPGTPPIQVLKEMVVRYGQAAASVNLRAVAAHDQITQAQAVVVASLIQAEGRHLSDFPKIARVIWNRLNLGMKLELDSTVLYAAHKYGIVASNAQLAIKSPYNTYLHQGLPPAPIDCPGEAALKAALHSPHASWLYFVTVNPKTGLTKFTSSPTVFAQLKAELNKYLQQHGGG